MNEAREPSFEERMADYVKEGQKNPDCAAVILHAHGHAHAGGGRDECPFDHPVARERWLRMFAIAAEARARREAAVSAGQRPAGTD